MGAPFSQIYGDDLSSTTTPASTDYVNFPGSTLFVGQCGDLNYMRPEPDNTAGLRMITGFKGRGTWRVNWCGSFTASQAAKTYHIALFVNGTKIAPTSREMTIDSVGSFVTGAGSGFIVMDAATAVLDIRVKSTTAATKLTLSHLSFGAQLVSTSVDLGTF